MNRAVKAYGQENRNLERLSQHLGSVSPQGAADSKSCCKAEKLKRAGDRLRATV